MKPVVESICRDLKLEVIFTNKTRDALRISKRVLPMLVILDLVVNGEMTGVQLITRLRRQEATKTTPIIVLTKKNALQDRAAAMEHGSNDYVVKPFNPDFLHDRIVALVNHNSLDDSNGS